MVGGLEVIRKSLAQAENVRAALLLVSCGEAPLGIVYQTDGGPPLRRALGHALGHGQAKVPRPDLRQAPL